MVGVLVLVHQHVPEPAAVGRRDVGEGLEQVDRDHDQVVEVHRARRDQAALVLRVRLGQRLLPGGARPGGERLVVLELVLQVRDLRRHRLRRVLAGVELELAADQRHQALRVGRVVDREVRRVAEPGRLAAQDADAGRVERHHPHRPGAAVAHQLRDPAGHLARRLVGERDREDLARRHVPLGQQVGDPVGEHPRLPRAGPGDDQQRPAGVDDGGALLRIEAVEEGGASRRSRLGRGSVKRAVTSQPAATEYHRYLQFFTMKCTGLATIAGYCAVS